MAEGILDEGRENVLASIAASSERAIEHQVRRAELMDRTSEQLLAIGAATIGAAITIAVFIGQENAFSANPVSVSLFGAGLVANLALLADLLVSNSGGARRADLLMSPDVELMRQKADDEAWSLRDQYTSLMASYASYAANNTIQLLGLARRRRREVAVLFGCVAAYLVAVVLIVGRAIL